MNFEVLGSRKSFFAALERAEVRLLFGVSTAVDQHLVAGVEAALRPLTAFPLAVVQVVVSHRAVRYADVIRELLQGLEYSEKREEND